MPCYQAFETLDPSSLERRPGVNVTGTTTYYGNAVGGSGVGQAIHLRWTGTPTGVLTLWCSNKREPNLTNDADWVQDTTSTLPNPAGAAGSALMDTTNTNAKMRRLKYVNATGAGYIVGEISTRGY